MDTAVRTITKQELHAWQRRKYKPVLRQVAVRLRSHAMRRTLSVLLLCGILGVSLPALAQSTGGSGQQAATNEVGAIDIREGDKGTHIRIRGTSEPTFSVFKLTNPLRLFVDISNSSVAGDSSTKRVGNGVLSKVALIDYEENSQSVARLIIGFDEPAHYDVKADGNDVVVFVDGAKRASGARSPSPQIEARLEKTQQKLSKVESDLRATPREQPVASTGRGPSLPRLAVPLPRHATSLPR